MLCRCFLLMVLLGLGIGQHTDGDAIRFTLYGEAKTWNEASAICLSIGGSMLHLHTTEDRDLLHTFSDKWTNDGNLIIDIWTGLYDNDIPGEKFEFFWDNCHFGFDNQTLWSTVDPTEPNLKGTQNCVRFAPHDGLKTRECSISYAVICQQVLDSCWFDAFQNQVLNEPDLVGTELLDLTVDQCEQKCLSLNAPDNLCVAYEFSSTKCTTYIGNTIYILTTPAMGNGISGISQSVHVKRCYQGIFVATAPTVPGNASDIPSAQCSNAAATSTTTTTTTTAPVATTTTTTTTTVSTTITTTPTPTATPTTTTTTTPTPTTTTTPTTTITTTTTTTSTTTTTTTIQTTQSPTTTAAPQTTTSTTTSATSQTTFTTSTISTTATTSSTTSRTLTTRTPASTSTTANTSTTASTLPPPVTTTMTVSTIHPASNECRLADRECLCMQYNPSDLAALEELIASLVLDKKHLSSYRRKKTSAPDHRVTATSIGNFGIAFLALVFISIILLDCGRVFRCVSSLKKVNDVNTTSSSGIETSSSNEEKLD